MTNDEKQTLHLFEMRVRQLMLNYKNLKEEAEDLRNMVEECNKNIERLTQENSECAKKYNDLKIARMIDVSSNDTEDAQKRIARLIREVDKCIALLNV